MRMSQIQKIRVRIRRLPVKIKDLLAIRAATLIEPAHSLPIGICCYFFQEQSVISRAHRFRSRT